MEGDPGRFPYTAEGTNWKCSNLNLAVSALGNNIENDAPMKILHQKLESSKKILLEVKPGKLP